MFPFRSSGAPATGQKGRTTKQTIAIAVAYLAVAVGLIAVYWYLNDYFVFVVACLAVVFIILTMSIQIGRYRRMPIRSNLYPLIGYVFLLVFGCLFAIQRLPSINRVLLEQLSVAYGLGWMIMLAASFLGFLFLGLWAWQFIKVREFLRTYVVLLAITVFTSCLGSILFTLFVFKVVEFNHLKLMAQGAKTEQLIMTERSDTALFVARTVASNAAILEPLINNNRTKLESIAQWYYDEAGLDGLYVVNKYGEILVSPGDKKEVGALLDKDPLVAFAILQKQQVKSFDIRKGVLAPVLVTRAVAPILKNDEVIGVIEARHTFDNAFVDFSKGRTGLDITIFTGDRRAATTIFTQDGVSRWTGSLLNDNNVTDKVLKQGVSDSRSAESLGRTYYSAYEPVRDVNGKIIGMVSAGLPVDSLLEDTRQQLLSAFMILAVLSLGIAFLGYFVLHKLYKQRT
jgi:hypothetical protein